MSKKVKTVFFERLNIIDDHHIADLKARDSDQNCTHEHSDHNNVFYSLHNFLSRFIDMLTLLIKRNLLLSALLES